ncbi:hypothetical protein LXA43DRAFT_882046 [Ganoderma leucocontextum]|nr:hypothetical protein LXA43DRAFT_882046 [Ganoderma leucocontextum]
MRPTSDISPPPATEKRLPLDRLGSEAMRDEELWFEDGTVALVAGNVEFCFYKDLLEDQSPVFRDMFASPQPSTPPGEPSECARVHLSDSAEDVRELLRMLLPDKQARLYSWRRLTFDALSACIRLGHKYQLDHIVDEAMTFVRKAYPKDFASYLERSTLHPEQAIGVVNLARLIGADDVLPLAIVDCCALSGTDLIQGLVRADGTREVLSSHDLALCFDAKGSLIRENARRLRRVTEFKPSRECDGRGCVAEVALATPPDEHDWCMGLTPRVLVPWGRAGTCACLVRKLGRNKHLHIVKMCGIASRISLGWK